MDVCNSREGLSALVDACFRSSFDQPEARVMILHACHIIKDAARKAFSNIGIPAKVVALMCGVAQDLGSAAFEKCKAVSVVFGLNVCNWPSSCARSIPDEEKNVIVGFNRLPAKSDVSSSRFVSVQNERDNFCAHIPHTCWRGHSMPAAYALSKVKLFVSNIAVEITPLWQNARSHKVDALYVTVGSAKGKLGLDRPTQKGGLRKPRYTASHPKDMTADLMGVHSTTDVLAPFVHLPVQSGSDRVLGVRTANLGKLATSWNARQNIQFSTETDSDFLDTVNSKKKAKDTSTFSFKYGKRDETMAASKDKTNEFDILQRNLAVEQKEDRKCFVKRILFKGIGGEAAQYIGKDVYMQSVVVESSEDLTGRFANVLINFVTPNCFFGDIIWPDQSQESIFW